ncbi:MAG: hypothetical protein HRU19_16000 [Pseudobacteriovorax sp.]|nr:hypothetical protein [Pseudobacteriovorax sp.]
MKLFRCDRCLNPGATSLVRYASYLYLLLHLLLEGTVASAKETTCLHRFMLKAGTETRVDLRASFTSPAWDRLIPMQRQGDTWIVDVEVPAQSFHEYKFFLDGRRWLADPFHSEATGPEGNSLLRPLDCLAPNDSQISGIREEGFWIYPKPAVAYKSQEFSAFLNTHEVFVESYQQAHYLRLAMKARTADNPLELTIQLDEPVDQFEIFPTAPTSLEKSGSHAVVLKLSEARHQVVTINGKKLFVLLDDLEDSDLPSQEERIDVVQRGFSRLGTMDLTQRLQDLINEAGATGKTLYFPYGVYTSGMLVIPSTVKIFLEACSILRSHPDPTRIPIDPGRVESGSDPSFPPDRRYLGRTMTYSRFLFIDQASNVSITGRGTIDGEGSFIRKGHNRVPNLIRSKQSSQIVIKDIMLRGAAAWSVHLLDSESIEIKNIKMINDRSNLNTDGIDPDMSRNVLIEDSFIYTKDDAICIKATGNSDLRGDVKHITVRRNLVSSVDAGLKVGTESDAQLFESIVFEDNAIFDSHRGLSIVVRDGALYNGIRFEKTLLGRNVTHMIEQVIGRRDPNDARGRIQDLSIVDLKAPYYWPPASNWTWYAAFREGSPKPGSFVHVFEGHDQDNSLRGLNLRGFEVRGQSLRTARDFLEFAGISFGPFVEAVSFD